MPAAVLFQGMDVPAEVGAYRVGRGFAPHGALPAMALDIATLSHTSLPAGYERLCGLQCGTHVDIVQAVVDLHDSVLLT